VIDVDLDGMLVSVQEAQLEVLLHRLDREGLVDLIKKLARHITAQRQTIEKLSPKDAI